MVFFPYNLNMNNKIYKQIWNKIKDYDNITLFTHVNPDGDTIGSSIALKNLINISFPNKEVKISGDKYPYNLKFLESNDKVSDEYINNSLAILIDGSSIARTFNKRILNAKEIIKIDHHHPEGNEWVLAVEGDNYPAAGQIIYEMIKVLDLKYDFKVVEGIFVAIWTDTSGLTERNPNEQTYEAIKWAEEAGLSREQYISKMDLSDKDKKLVDKLVENYTLEDGVAYKINQEVVTNSIYRPATEKFRNSIDAEIYIFAAKDEFGNYRVGLRSKALDVSKIAERHNGGGHVVSSGAKVKQESEIFEIIKEAKELVNN